MEKVVICGWICPECEEKYNWKEVRLLPVGYVASCENCLDKYIGDFDGPQKES